MLERTDLLLIQLAEECAEVAVNISKSLRFGLKEVYEPIGVSNMNRIQQELNDVLALVELLQAEGALPQECFIRSFIDTKKTTVEEYMVYSRQLGRVK